MGWKDLLGSAAEHIAGDMANKYGRFSRDSRLSEEQREKAAAASDRLRDFRDAVHESRRGY